MENKKEPKQLEWNVFRFDINSKEIRLYNIFDHAGFCNSVTEIKRELSWDKTRFAEELRRRLQYYFWAKAEYEIIIGTMFGDTERKVDIYTQIINNWEIFRDYVYEN